ncbi:NAD(P)H-dependent glycerol-3-phosphate dehydrogenase [Legionella spiritensis]|uniref:Glycerol-3-phosphate dehydrogenase [NAD(P)+] n=1 Tax=Legionella spiritensis TaxID=452 RepID=A0A0W0Z5V9_LEGSP|nr:NAD(P)H-dependent glycerol-3-phosphate dehydrogenase [Legionella spiritensis]KTD64509.1 glycerol-3-phosphate dehydrogenase (NAD+) [Legionella spiritensis]SNV33166.1 glycerol-3-phosphate dehydrogenase (NAD+) [Legionella spiritensis]VEG92349.1 glycerol-3-phosphate dehydrogenase (NAD+) [Legionella spiritensis]
MAEKTIAILGAGSWGTAVAIHLANQGNRVLLWARNREHVAEMRAHRCNTRYLPGITFPDTLEPVADLATCQENAAATIVAVPSHAFADLLTKMRKPEHGLSWLTKGLDPVSNELLSELVQQRWGDTFPFAVISGPSFAREVALGLPTAITLAGNNNRYQKTMQKLLHQQNLRVYLSQDLIGVQICGTVKNVLAIACGISDGLGYGANSKAALITRGLAEMRRLGLALGAREDTFMGLAGVGDLVLTCTDDQSRNRRFGLQLGQGIDLNTAEKNIGQVVEGKQNAAQVCKLAKEHRVEMPICFQISALIQNHITPEQAASNLMSRDAKEE